MFILTVFCLMIAIPHSFTGGSFSNMEAVLDMVNRSRAREHDDAKRSEHVSSMRNRTVANDKYKGLVEAFSIPAGIVERDGKKFAKFGSVVPIHCCSPEEIKVLSNKTHHYCDIFTEQLLAPLGELAYVRIDDNTAEKVFINRSKRILIVSSDGKLAQWRCAPTFESNNQYFAGTPLVNKDGALVSVVTAKRGNHYAASSFEGEGGYFETSLPWKVIDAEEGASVYGDRQFKTREELRAYVSSLPALQIDAERPTLPVLVRGAQPRLALVAGSGGRQLSHHYLQGVLATDIQYL